MGEITFVSKSEEFSLENVVWRKFESNLDCLVWRNLFIVMVGMVFMCFNG